MRMAIIGTGLAGLACAQTVAARGVEVVLFDKSRGFGGRVASRRREGVCFDHGLPAFDPAPDVLFADLSEWAGGMVAAPRMNSLPRGMGERYTAHLGCRIAQIRREGAGVQLVDTQGAEFGPFSHVAVAVPAPQAMDLLAGQGDAFAAISEAHYAPCWTLMLGGVAGAAGSWTRSGVESDVLSSVICEDSKPGRAAAGCWTAHARTDWVRDHLEREAGEIADILSAEFTRVTGVEAARCSYKTAHRWRFSTPEAWLEAPYLLDGTIGACGDWCGTDRTGGDARAAWRSGVTLAEAFGG